MSVIFTVGVFDLFHYGHKELFRRMKEYVGEQGKLIVAVQNGDSILKYKPEAKVVYSTQERVEMVEQCRYVDQVVLYSDVDEIVKQVDFDIWAKGPDQVHQGFQKAIEWCKKNGKEIYVIPRTDGISSTHIRNIVNDFKVEHAVERNNNGKVS